MPNTLRLLQIVLPVFLVIGAGYAMRRARILTEAADESLLGVLIKLFVPCLALDVIIGNEALTRPANLFLPPLAGFGTVALGIGGSLLAGRLFLKGKSVQRTFACAAGLQNYSYIPVPLCLALYDRETVGVLFAFNLGTEVALWTIAVATLADKDPERRWWTAIFNPPVVAVIAGLLLNLAGAAAWTPASVTTAWHMLGLCAVPLGLLLSGAVLADYATPHVLRSGWKTTILGLLLRLGILPLATLGFARVLPADPALQSVMLLQAAMPSAVFPIVLAKIHKGDMPTALRVVLGTSIAALATIPLWLSLGLPHGH